MSQTSANSESQLVKTLGTWSATAVVVGSVVGSSIFRLPGGVAREVGSPGAIFLVWTLGGIIALCGALSLAELAALYPRTGGIYVFLRETYGRWAAFLFGWAMLVVNPAAYAFIAMVFAEAWSTLVPALKGAERIVAAVSLAILVLINVRPVRVGAALLNVTTWLKVAVLVLLSVAALLFAGDWNTATSAGSGFSPNSWSGFGLALILVMGAYDGWQWVPQLAGELRDPLRSLPRALGLGVLSVIGVYLLANAAYVMVLSPQELAESSLVTADMARRLLGAVGAGLVSGLILVSSFGSNHSGMMTDPRVFLTMAEDGLFFRGVGAIHPKHRTPHVAVILLGAAAIAYLFIRGVEQLIATLILGMWPFLAMSVVAVFIQRNRRPEAARPFRVPLYPWVPLFFLIACAGIFANSFREQPRFTLINFAVLLAGLPVYWLWRRLGLATRTSE
jgi:basic amino acid/polyamine antiporter, APA family